MNQIIYKTENRVCKGYISVTNRFLATKRSFRDAIETDVFGICPKLDYPYLPKPVLASEKAETNIELWTHSVPSKRCNIFLPF